MSEHRFPTSGAPSGESPPRNGRAQNSDSPVAEFRRERQLREVRDRYEADMTALETENMRMRRELDKARKELEWWRERSDPDAVIRLQSLKIEQLTEEFEKLKRNSKVASAELSRVEASNRGIEESLVQAQRPPQTPPGVRRYGRRPAPPNHPALKESIVFCGDDNEAHVERVERSFGRMSRQEMEDAVKGLELEKAMLARKINRSLPKVHNIETLQQHVERENDETRYDNVCRMLTKLKMDMSGCF